MISLLIDTLKRGKREYDAKKRRTEIHLRLDDSPAEAVVELDDTVYSSANVRVGNENKNESFLGETHRMIRHSRLNAIAPMRIFCLRVSGAGAGGSTPTAAKNGTAPTPTPNAGAGAAQLGSGVAMAGALVGGIAALL